jgi:hypothetical protein
VARLPMRPHTAVMAANAMMKRSRVWTPGLAGVAAALLLAGSSPALVACGALVPPPGADAGMDGGAPSDSGPRVDAALDAGAPLCVPPAGPPPHAGCHPELGIECDGDWEGRCAPGCAEDECCSPQLGRFTCVPRHAGGACPAADLFVDGTRLAPWLEYRYFAPGDCAIVEGCVREAGARRLLRFDVWTPNVGGADVYLGAPGADTPYFEYSPCHRHDHFRSYADYELLSSDGSCIAATGHKQAFCLLDYYAYPCDPDDSNDDPSVPECRPIAGYHCSNQGIRRGAQDVYESTLDCQWVDVTDVAPGDYLLRVRLNTEHLIAESDYANNDVGLPVSIPEPPGDVDVTLACPASTLGPTRDCGWTAEGEHGCVPGETVQLGCSEACGLGACTGNAMLRACDARVGDRCTLRHTLGLDDDSGCGTTPCRHGGDCCPRTELRCPASGRIRVFFGASESTAEATCEVALVGHGAP